jgi:DNA-directed RNA polymerase III subunit RPC4
MTASGPFAMGPSQVGSSSWLSGPRISTTMPIGPRGTADAVALGANLSKTAAPTLKKERAERPVHVDEDDEVYSDPDEGVEIVDMRNVHAMDWMAPESLKVESARETKRKVVRVKKEGEVRAKVKEKGARIFFWFVQSVYFEAVLTPIPRLNNKKQSSGTRWQWMYHQLWMT